MGGRFNGRGGRGGRFVGGPRGGPFGRGPPGPGGRDGRGPMRGRGPLPFHPMNMPGRDMKGRQNMQGRGPMPGRGPPFMNRGGPPPPPPPRGRGMHRGPPPPPPPRMRPNMPPPLPPRFPQQHPNQHQSYGHAMPPPRGPLHAMGHPPPPPMRGHPTQIQQGMHTIHQSHGPPYVPPNIQQPFPANAIGPNVSAQGPGQASSGSQSATPAPATTYTQDQIDQAWTEHTAPNSHKYYYNAITKESSYNRPKSLQTEPTVEEKPAETASSAWAEYTDPSTGKKYYSDGTTTTWEKPKELKDADGSKRKSETDENDEGARKKKKIEKASSTEFNNKEEAVAAFKGLLLAKDVLPTTKWNEVLKQCSSDSRWEACTILSVGERKQALAEYQTKRANDLKAEERLERMRAKKAFTDLLSEVLPSVDGFSALGSRFSDMRGILAKNDRFYAVEDEDTRESLFLDFCEEVRKRDERKKRTKKREAKDEFLSFLREQEECGKLTFASTWASFFASLDDDKKNDQRLATNGAMSESDRELYFSDRVLDLQNEEDEKRRRIRTSKLRAEKAQREAYRERLRELAIEGVILPSSRWSTSLKVISQEPSYGPVQAQDSEVPRELFEDFVEEWHETYRRDRSTMSRLVHSSTNSGIEVNAKTSYEEFSKALLDKAAYSPELYSEIRRALNRDDPITSARLFYDELLGTSREAVASGSSKATRRSTVKSSSEDEGEIREDGEISDDEDTAEKKEEL